MITVTRLYALKDFWQNTPPSWVDSNPCGSNWDGILCTSSRVTSIRLSSMGLIGQLPGDIQFLSELKILDLSNNKGLSGPLPASIGNLNKLTNLILVGCSFSGRIPDSIGSLQRLVFLSLNSNRFSGPIPPSIGNLSNLFWLDLTDNQLTGSIPVSSSTTPGLDMLVNTRHFHLGKNQLSGTIPPQLFSSNMKLIHVLFDSNNLSGSIPSTLGLVTTLEVVRLDRNSLTGTIPSSLNNLSSVSELILSNNKFSGPVPNVSGLTVLNYLDMSNNGFDASDFPPWLSTLQSLTTLMMECTHLQGQVPSSLFSLSNLQTVVLRNNFLSGSLDIGSSPSEQLHLIDLRENSISDYNGGNRVTVILADNPVCQETGATQSYCTVTQPTHSDVGTRLPSHCKPASCIAKEISSPNCSCAYPYTGQLVFVAPSFSNLGNSTLYTSLQKALMDSFQSLQLAVDSVSLRNPTKDSCDYLDINLQVFPSDQDRFNRTVIAAIGFLLSNQTFNPPEGFGPYYFISDMYFAEQAGSGKSSSTGIIIEATVGGCVLLLLLLLTGMYAYHQKKRAKRASEEINPFAHWNENRSSGGVPQLMGARRFRFEELKKYTKNFSEANQIGSGGYGKVYRGTLADGRLIAIKRTQQGSMESAVQFKTEIELLSRVHHKNLISLLGFCFERHEQMLIYEFAPNGTLRDSLSGQTGIRLDWPRRLKVALGAARGLSYLHELANPPIIHRDIKSTNILLDTHLNAKVGDFGISKILGDGEEDHVSTQVRGTLGYLDPEYYMTQQLTEKSDVYGFGVVMLELITGRRPIEKRKYIVRDVKLAMDVTKDLYNLQEFLDPGIGLDTTWKGLNRFVDVAMRCVQVSGDDRPTMGEVAKEIENILQLAGLHSDVESTSTSASYEEANKGSYPCTMDSFGYSEDFPFSKIEPQ
uniref:non-specific serine/threonine protein kinase n=1 Tax=Rhizophora mucronata TaxID=61149 RepID=A0A2P2JI85_RHIMU